MRSVTTTRSRNGHRTISILSLRTSAKLVARGRASRLRSVGLKNSSSPAAKRELSCTRRRRRRWNHDRCSATPLPCRLKPIRDVLAAWITSRDNSFFAQVMVNRVWTDLMERGLVEPVDDLRASNPPSNGPLLEALVPTSATTATTSRN